MRRRQEEHRLRLLPDRPPLGRSQELRELERLLHHNAAQAVRYKYDRLRRDLPEQQNLGKPCGSTEKVDRAAACKGIPLQGSSRVVDGPNATARVIVRDRRRPEA